MDHKVFLRIHGLYVVLCVKFLYDLLYFTVYECLSYKL